MTIDDFINILIGVLVTFLAYQLLGLQFRYWFRRRRIRRIRRAVARADGDADIDMPKDIRTRRTP